MSSHTQATRSLLSIEDLSKPQVHDLIQKAVQLKGGQISPLLSDKPLVAALVFFEPSTRTRFSFEIAAHRMLLHPISFVADTTTSLTKGESLPETLSTLLAMRPDILVVRHSGDANIDKIMAESKVPVVNAGSGATEHPTQALLDAMTVIERKTKVVGQKILYVGDVEHSRVAKSGVKLFRSLGAEVAICAPAEFVLADKIWTDCRQFSSLAEALKWCTVCIGLRIQKERHGVKSEISQNAYVEKYRLDNKSLSVLSDSAIIMHPGPFVADVDISEEVLRDHRCAIHEQVTNGVFMRMAVMGDLLGLSYS